MEKIFFYLRRERNWDLKFGASKDERFLCRGSTLGSKLWGVDNARAGVCEKLYT